MIENMMSLKKYFADSNNIAASSSGANGNLT